MTKPLTYRALILALSFALTLPVIAAAAGETTTQYGTDMIQDKVQAKEWYRQSCDNGLLNACDEYEKLDQ